MATQQPRPGQVQCPKCGRWCDTIWSIEGDPDFKGCAEYVRRRLAERQKVAVAARPPERSMEDATR